MRFSKIISTILHPIVVPTIGVMSYFLLIPNNFIQQQKLFVLSLVFVVTYLIPLMVLIVLKKLKLINNFQTESIKERKLPVALMVILFYLLGNSLENYAVLKDLGLLFYSSSFGLTIIYFLFYFKIKASIHLLSLGISASFFMVLGNLYYQSFTIVIIAIFLLAGLLASARLNLNAHTVKEVYLGFFIGIIAPILLHFIL